MHRAEVTLASGNSRISTVYTVASARDSARRRRWMIKMNNYRRSSSATSARARLMPSLHAGRTPTPVADINNRTRRARNVKVLAGVCTCDDGTLATLHSRSRRCGGRLVNIHDDARPSCRCKYKLRNTNGRNTHAYPHDTHIRLSAV